MTGEQYSIESAIDKALTSTTDLYEQKSILRDAIRYAEKLLDDVDEDIKQSESEK